MKLPSTVTAGLCVDSVLEGVIADVLKTRLVDDLRANHLRVADLECVFGYFAIITLRRKDESADAIVGFGVAIVLIAGSQGVVLRQMPNQSEGSKLVRWRGLGIDSTNGVTASDGVKDDRINGGQFVDVPALEY